MGFATKAEASTALANVQVSLATGTFVEASRQTVDGFLNLEWLPAIASTIRPTTFNGYRMHVERHVVPHLGEQRLQQITGGDLNRFYSNLLTDGRLDGTGALSPMSVRHIHATLHRAFHDAVRWGRLTRNPADQADPPTGTASKKKEMTTWTAAEVRHFLDHISGDRLRGAYVLAATTGMRRGELAGLQWGDLDLEARTISIRRARVSVGGQAELSEPKTRRSRRQISLDTTTVAALRHHRAQQLRERVAWGPAWRDTGFVSTREDGTPIHPETLTKVFQRRVRKAGLPRIRLHDLRHTHATLALRAGIHPKVIPERLGHASVGITLDTYSHAIPAMQEEAAEQIAALVFDQ